MNPENEPETARQPIDPAAITLPPTHTVDISDCLPR